MVVIVLTAAPSGLRGALTRWLLEISTGVFVGNISGRVREQVWQLINENIGSGRAVMVRSVRNEQRYCVQTIGHEREPIDLDGFLAMCVPHTRKETNKIEGVTRASEGWSIAGRRRKFGNGIKRSLDKGR